MEPIAAEYVTIMGTAMSGVIGALWYWGNGKNTQMISLVENAQSREDTREQAFQDRLAAEKAELTKTFEQVHQDAQEQIKRLEKSRDFARDQYNQLLKEQAQILAEKQVRNTSALEESNDLAELIIPLLQKLMERDGDGGV